MKGNSIIIGMIASATVFVGGYFISRLIRKYIDGGLHSPGLSHLLLLVLFITCVCWLIIGVMKLKSNNSGRFWIGSAVMNFCFIGYAVTYLIIEFNKGRGASTDEAKQSLIIQRNDSGSVVLNQKGDTLLYNRGDSTMIDKRDQIDYNNLKIKDSGRKVE